MSEKQIYLKVAVVFSGCSKDFKQRIQAYINRGWVLETKKKSRERPSSGFAKTLVKYL